jgi:hypothetical protein
MLKFIYIFLASILFCASSWAQSNSIINETSPKLKKFLLDNPQAEKIFTNAISTAFSNKTVQLFYFYSDDKSQARAYHFYPKTVGSPDVMLCIRENQTPLDEFITTLFETLNTKKENAFAELSQDAYSGAITKEQFAKGILRNEFEATKSVQSILLELKLGTNELNGSYYYSKFSQCPTDFDDFLAYSKKVSQNRDVMKEYELKYDSLRKMYFDSNTATNLVAPQN